MDYSEMKKKISIVQKKLSKFTLRFQHHGDILEDGLSFSTIMVIGNCKCENRLELLKHQVRQTIYNLEETKTMLEEFHGKIEYYQNKVLEGENP